MDKQPPRPYIDDDGVLRGYYVYLHRVELGGEVFYVGKGVGRRAWTAGSRNDDWTRKVEALGGRFEVEIVEADLTELEAYELEERLVAEYVAKSDGDALTNRVAGGSPGLSVGLSMKLPQSLQQAWARYDETRRFADLDRTQQLAFVDALQPALDQWMSTLEQMSEIAESSDDEQLEDSVYNLDVILGSFGERVSDLRKRRISWHELCLELEEVLDDLRDDDLQAECTEHTAPLLNAASSLLGALFERVDSGNREEAEAASKELGQDDALAD